MKVTVILAAYNGDKYLMEQLQSLSFQEHAPDELIVCDDCSSDSTADIINDYRDIAPFPVSVVRSMKRGGVSANFSHGLSLATGDYVFFCDQDDVWYPDKISRVIDVFEKNKLVDLVINDMVIVDEKLVGTGVTMSEQVKHSGIQGLAGGVAGCATAVRASVLPLIMPVSTPVAQYDVWIHRLVDLWGGRYVLNAVLQKHRRHSHNFSKGLSSLQDKVSRLSTLWSEFKKSPVRGIELRLNQWEYIINHLSGLDGTDRVDEIKIKQAIDRANTILVKTQERKKVLQIPLPLRLFHIPRAVCRGAYSGGRGRYLAILKDIMHAKVYRG
jgi:glycosyltransferase involved in cell wall biosynthesis